MAGAGLGRVVALVPRREDYALLQPPQAASEMLAILREEIGGELVDRDSDDEFGRRTIGGRGRNGEGSESEESGEAAACHAGPPGWRRPIYSSRRFRQAGSTLSTWAEIFASEAAFR